MHTCFFITKTHISLVMRKPAVCICENKDADQLRSNSAIDQRLCFHYTDSTIPLLPKSEISSLLPSSVAVQPGLCRTWSKTAKTGFLTTRFISVWEQTDETGWEDHACQTLRCMDAAGYIYCARP